MPGRVAEAANMLATVDRGTSCLHIAARNGHPRLVELFLERGIEIDTPSDLGWTAMHFASVANEIGIILLLIANGAKMEATTRDGATPLHLAASHGSQDVVLKLLEMGVNINIVDTTSIMTPLHYAASRGQLDTLGILLMNKANPKAQDNTDWTPLHYIAGKAEAGDEKWVSCARLLLAEDIDLEAIETSGRTVLHLASSNGADEIVQLLLQHGANIHAESCIEYRPIDYAIMNGHQAVVLRLIKAGANINGANGRAMYLAVTKGHGDVARLLWKHGGSIEDYPELQDEFTALDDIEQEVHTYLTGPNEISPEDRLAIDRVKNFQALKLAMLKLCRHSLKTTKTLPSLLLLRLVVIPFSKKSVIVIKVSSDENA
jgi:serine/threonine-protein phosphatase 6 regulatory ankyrin repeat subunit B